MLLLLPLAIPVLGAGLILLFHNPRAATRLALLVGGVEIAVLGTVVWQVHTHGELQQGRYLRADGLSAFFLMGIAIVSGLVQVARGIYQHEAGNDRDGSTPWFSCFSSR